MDTGHKAILPKPVRSRKTLRISRLHIQLYVWTRSHCSTKGHLSAQENQTCLWDTASPLLTFIKQPASICWQTQERSHFCHTTNDLHPFSSAADWISTPMREPVSSTAINRDIPDLTSRRNTWYDKFLCAWKKVNSNSLFCVSKYIITGQDHISNPSHITLRSIVCIEIISTHSSVGLHGSLCIAGRIEPE